MRFTHVLAGMIPGAVLLVAAVDDWPRWRGPFENGVARGDAPVEWSDQKNIAWKTAIPGRGHSSPVIWGDKIFLTTAIPTRPEAAAPAPPPPPPPGERKGPGPGGPGGFRKGGGGAGGGAASGIEHKFVIMCLDRNTGKILWEVVATVAIPHEGYHRRYGSFASNSPVTDGKMVYAFFGSRGIYAYDLNGRLQWKKDFRPMKTRLEFGEGTAAVLHDNYLILNFDQMEDSYITVLDKNTGAEMWRMSRDEPSAWAAPLVVEHNGRKQVITAATNRVRSYDLKTGKLIWECAGLGSNVIPAPVTQNGIVYVMSGHREPNLLAIKLGREGDLTGTDAILWTNQRGNSYSASPVLDGNKLYMVTDNGMVSCLDATTGQPHYLQQRLDKPYNFKSSPVAASGKLYLATENGDVVVLKMGEKYEVLATNTLADQMFIASPAVAGGSLYLRSQGTLFCIRK